MRSEITFSKLYRQLGGLRGTGRIITEGEVGPETWKVILRSASCEEKTMKEGWFAGVHIVPANVPEGMIWPCK